MSGTYSFNYFGSIINAQPLGVDFVPPLPQTITAHCVPVTEDGKIVAINITGRGVDIPGGHIDEGETAENAMLRETYEEAAIEVGHPILIDVWLLSSDNDRIGLMQKPYLLVYAARVRAMEEFHPNEEADKRFVLSPDEFIEQYFGDKEQAAAIVAKAMAALK